MRFRSSPVTFRLIIVFTFFLTLASFALLEFSSAPTMVEAATSSTAEQAPDRYQQETGQVIFGRLTDEGGNALVGLRVQAVRSDGLLFDEAITRMDGSYEMLPLPPGTYDLQVAAQGWEQEEPLPLARVILDGSGAQPVEQSIVVQQPVKDFAARRPQKSDATGQISGVVKAADTNAPFYFVSVTAYDTEGTRAGSDYTDKDGIYAIEELETGQYTVFFQQYSSDYAPEWYANKGQKADATPVSVTDGQTTANINAVLDIGAKISGTVTAQENDATLKDVTVRLYDDAGTYFPGQTTPANGEYEFSGLQAGKYRLLYEPTSYGDSALYMKEYYNNKPDLDSADVINVTLGEEKSGVNAKLVKGAQISGIVTAEGSGDPLEGVYVTLKDSEGNSAGSKRTGADGKYTITGLKAGSYRLEFNPSYGSSALYLKEYYNDKLDLDSADVINLTVGEDKSGIDAKLLKGAQISGIVTAEGSGDTLEDVSVTLYDIEGKSVTSRRTEADGEYAFTGLGAGGYRIEFRPTSSGSSALYIKEYYNDKPDLESADVINVAAAEEKSGINVTLVKGAQISGKVTAESSGDPLDDVYVRLYDSEGESVDTEGTEETGEYTFTGLRAGDYRIKFDPGYGSSALYLEEFYNDKPDLESADVISATAAAIINNIDAKLIMSGVIEGTVTAQDTKLPLADVVVSAYLLHDDGCGTITYRLITSETTEADGLYKLDGLPTGSFRVRFDPKDPGAAEEYVEEWYDDKPDRWEADPVDVIAPAVVSDIDAALERVKKTSGGQIKGEVTAEDTGLPLEGVSVAVYDSEGGYVDSVYTNAEGLYTTERLPTGDYKLWFGTFYSDADKYLSEYYNNKADRDSADVVKVVSPNVVSGIDAALAPGGQIGGKVTAADSKQPLNNVTVVIYDADGSREDSVSTDDQGNYLSAGLVSGSYTVEFKPSSTGDSADYIAEFYNNKADENVADPVTVAAPKVVSNINGALARGGAISGQVTDEETGAPIKGVEVSAYNSEGDIVAEDRTDDDGNYSLRGLRTGEYRVHFFYEEIIIDGCSTFAFIVHEYYDDKLTLSTADIIPVTAPKEVTGINAKLDIAGALAKNQWVYLPVVIRLGESDATSALALSERVSGRAGE